MSQNIRLSQTYSLPLFENYQKSLIHSKSIFGGEIQIYPNLVRSRKMLKWDFLSDFSSYVIFSAKMQSL